MPYSKLNLENYTTREVVNKLMDMFPIKRQRIKIDNHIPDEKVYIDATKFTLALRNLLDNAIKYSSDNMEIYLIIVKNDDVEFRVKDSGIGISKKNIHKITESFYQENQTASTKGFGLGLTICKKIIESHKGKLRIESEKEKGSCFILHLPAN